MIITINTEQKTIEVSGEIDMKELQSVSERYSDYKMVCKVTEVITEKWNYAPYPQFIPWNQPSTNPIPLYPTYPITFTSGVASGANNTWSIVNPVN